MTYGQDGTCALSHAHRDPVANCLELNDRASGLSLFSGKRSQHPDNHFPWRISPELLRLSPEQHLFLRGLGTLLLRFYQASNKLYFDSVKGHQPSWVADYLDQGKPAALVEFARMNRQKRLLPGLIRPDLLFTDEGRAVACELDAVPGGQGFVAFLSQAYAQLGFEPVGGEQGMAEGFESLIRAQVPEKPKPVLAVVVSQEAHDYWDEMVFVAEQLNRRGRMEAHVVRPEALRYLDDGLYLEEVRVDVLYRFFELFDLKNIPRTELIMYAAKKQQVAVTAPFKPFLEEKMLFALFHHPVLRPFWLAELGVEPFGALERLLPRTWILDPRPLPPHGVIPGLTVGDRAVRDWHDLVLTTKKQREYVLKPSGFSEFAWGSRGISFGDDLSTEDWKAALDHALDSFEHTPYLLQEYHKPTRQPARYYDFARGEVRSFEGRARICPYYFVEGEQARLMGILATICPADKRAIHGMVDSVMVPVVVESRSD